jgi:DNA-binding HxlR family transcriptional regulator
MQHTPTKLEQRIRASLAERGDLRYGELMIATQAGNSPLLARTLKRMQRYGAITRTIVDAAPPHTLYALAAKEQPAAE